MVGRNREERVGPRHVQDGRLADCQRFQTVHLSAGCGLAVMLRPATGVDAGRIEMRGDAGNRDGDEFAETLPF